MQAMITTLQPIGNSMKNSVSGQKKETFASVFSLPEAWKQNSTAKVIDRERAAVYLYEKTVDLTKLHLQKEEVDEVFWIDLEELEKILQDPTAKYCVYKEEIQGIKKYL